jgi:hypothetical protein
MHTTLTAEEAHALARDLWHELTEEMHGAEGGEPAAVVKAWQASEHPRSDDGRFVDAHDLHAAQTDPAKAAELRAKVTQPEERAKLDAALPAEAQPEAEPAPVPGSPAPPAVAPTAHVAGRLADALRGKTGRARQEAWRAVAAEYGEAAVKAAGAAAGLDFTPGRSLVYGWAAKPERFAAHLAALEAHAGRAPAPPPPKAGAAVVPQLDPVAAQDTHEAIDGTLHPSRGAAAAVAAAVPGGAVAKVGAKWMALKPSPGRGAPAPAAAAPTAAGTPGSVSALSDADFAAKVRAAADAQTHGFGPHKVYIGDVFDALAAEDPALTRAEFDRRLVAAHAAGALNLSRADLVQHMDPEVVHRSSVRHPSGVGEFHFLDAAPAARLERERPSERKAFDEHGAREVEGELTTRRVESLGRTQCYVEGAQVDPATVRPSGTTSPPAA